MIFFKNGGLLCPQHLLTLNDHNGEIAEDLYRDIFFSERLEWLQKYRSIHPEESDKVIDSAAMIRRLWGMHIQMEKIKKEAHELYGRKIIIGFAN